MSASTISSIETEVLQTLEDFFRTARTLDLDRFIEFFDRSEATTWIDDGGFFAKSWDGLHTWLGPVFSQWKNLTELHLDNISVDNISPGVVVVTGMLTMAGTFKTGEAIQLRQAGTYVLVQREDKWKIRYLQATRVPD